jgi:hypothetical protein
MLPRTIFSSCRVIARDAVPVALVHREIAPRVVGRQEGIDKVIGGLKPQRGQGVALTQRHYIVADLLCCCNCQRFITFANVIVFLVVPCSIILNQLNQRRAFWGSTVGIRQSPPRQRNVVDVIDNEFGSGGGRLRRGGGLLIVGTCPNLTRQTLH